MSAKTPMPTSQTRNPYERALHNMHYGQAQLVVATGAAGSGAGNFIREVKQKHQSQVRSIHVGTLIRDDLQRAIDLIELSDHSDLGATAEFIRDELNKQRGYLTEGTIPAIAAVVESVRYNKVTFRTSTAKWSDLRLPRLMGVEFVLYKKWENDVRRFSQPTFWAEEALRVAAPTLELNRSVLLAGVNDIGDLSHLRKFGAFAIRLEHDTGLDDDLYPGIPEHHSMDNAQAYDLIIDVSRTGLEPVTSTILSFMTL